MIIPFTKYKCSDGKIYDTLDEAQQHEIALAAVQVWRVDYVQGTEQKVGYILVHCFSKHQLFVEDWCYKTYGNRIKFTNDLYMNDKLVEIWKITKLEKKATELTDKDVILAKLEEALIVNVF